jgi:hypothetical protein
MNTSFATLRAKLGHGQISNISLVLVAATSLCAGNALAGGTFYTIKPPASGGNFELYKIEVTNGPNAAQSSLLSTSSFTCVSCGTANRVNAFSYNPVQNNVFFFNSNTTTPTLYSVQATNGGLFQDLGTVSGLPNNVNRSGAAFFNNTIYAIANNSDTLYSIPVSYIGSSINVGSATPISLGTGARAFGDLAIDPGTQTLYGYSTGNTDFPSASFFRYSLTAPGSLSFGPVNTSPTGLQIAFGNSDNLLYGVTTTGEWRVVDKATGQTTLFANTVGAQGTINDLAGGYPVPGPLPILGAAAAFRASRNLRSRVRHAKRSSVTV